MFQCQAICGKEEKKKEENIPFVEKTWLKSIFLIFKLIYFPGCSSQMTENFLYRGFGQCESNGELFVLILILILGAMGFYIS
jgi:hypothetical protein